MVATIPIILTKAFAEKLYHPVWLGEDEHCAGSIRDETSIFVLFFDHGVAAHGSKLRL